MFSILMVLFIVIPLIEAYLLVTVGSVIGALPTLSIMLLTGIVGAALARREGLMTIRRVQTSLNQGQLPGKALMDGALVLAGGLLLLTPGFMTDIVGFFCLFPLTRGLLRGVIWQGVKHIAETKVAHSGGAVIINVEGHSTGQESANGFSTGHTVIEIGQPRPYQEEQDWD